MGRYVIRRLLQMIPVLIGTTFVIYAGVFLLPGDPVRALFGERPPSPALLQQIREQYNLNDPFILQYLKYMLNAATGDFGMNFRRRDVWDIFWEAAPTTIKLALTAFFFEIVIGLIAGVLAGLRRGGFIDNLVLITTTLIISIPSFVLGFVAQLTIAGKQEWLGGIEIFPIASDDAGWPRAFLLPALILASLSLAQLARLTRTSLVENLRADYVRTAIAKGLSRRRVIGKHAFRNSLIPVITLLGIDIGALMGGAIVTESIFNLNGIGSAVYKGIRLYESPVVVGICTMLVIIFIIANLVVDILYGVLDPRIRYD